MIISREDYTCDNIKRLTKDKAYIISYDMSEYGLYLVIDDTGNEFTYMTWRFYNIIDMRDKQLDKVLQ